MFVRANYRCKSVASQLKSIFSIAEQKNYVGAKYKQKKKCAQKEKVATTVHRGEKSEIYFSLKYLVLILRKMVDLNLPLLGYEEHGATREKGFRNGKSYLLLPCAHTHFTFIVCTTLYIHPVKAGYVLGMDWRTPKENDGKNLCRTTSGLSFSLSLSRSRVLFMPPFRKAINDSSFDRISHQSFQII